MQARTKKLIVNMNTKILSLIILSLALNGCGYFEKEKSVLTETERFIKPPIANANIPFDEFDIEVGKGDTIFSNSGSILLFPPNAFIDREGKIVQGNVQLKYKEFSTPIDFYLSGIPMDFDSLDKHYNFESSGMCQVLAFKDGDPVFVNPLNKPEIYLASNNKSDLHKIYYLDTVQRKWIEKGESIVTDLSNYNNNLQKKAKEKSGEFSNIEEPIMPAKANTNSPIIKIVVDPASIKELLGYDNLQFQVLDNIENFDPNASNDEWKNVEIEKSKIKGQYIVQFSNDKKTITHTVKPVLEGKDYDKALKVFEKKQSDYTKQKNIYFENEKLHKEQYVRDSIENHEQILANEKTARLNQLILERNIEIEMRNKTIEENNKEIKSINLSNKILRGFDIDSFGLINCDILTLNNNSTFFAKFTDKSGNQIELKNIAVIYETFRGWSNVIALI